jgi:hypothetical protein
MGGLATPAPWLAVTPGIKLMMEEMFSGCLLFKRSFKFAPTPVLAMSTARGDLYRLSGGAHLQRDILSGTLI